VLSAVLMGFGGWLAGASWAAGTRLWLLMV
jgi:hypothetical protein